jgi:hypothetical protein
MEYLAVCLVSGIWAGLLARHKGSSFWMWMIIGAVLPFLGVIGAALSRHEDDELRKQCPGCGKVVPLYDALCMRCGTELDFPEVAIEPRSRSAQRA